MSDPIRIREAVAGDSEALVRFNQAMAEETEGKRLDAATLGHGVRRLLAQPEHGFYVVAEAAGALVGGLMITTEWSDWRDGFFWWVQSVYVLPAWRRRGIYRALYEHVRAGARAALDVRGLRLYVERENHGARRVYEHLGMQETRYRLYEELL